MTDDALIDVSAFVKGTLNAHFRADYVGAKSLKQFEDTHKKTPDSFEPQSYMSYFMDNMKMKSMDLVLEDRGLVSDHH